MKVRLEMVVEMDEKKWDDVYELEAFVRRLLTPYMPVLKGEARREWYDGEFE